MVLFFTKHSDGIHGQRLTLFISDNKTQLAYDGSTLWFVVRLLSKQLVVKEVVYIFFKSNNPKIKLNYRIGGSGRTVKEMNPYMSRYLEMQFSKLTLM